MRQIAAGRATHVTPIVLHLRPGAREWFLGWLARGAPGAGAAATRSCTGAGAYAPQGLPGADRRPGPRAGRALRGRPRRRAGPAGRARAAGRRAASPRPRPRARAAHAALAGRRPCGRGGNTIDQHRSLFNNEILLPGSHFAGKWVNGFRTARRVPRLRIPCSRTGDTLFRAGEPPGNRFRAPAQWHRVPPARAACGGPNRVSGGGGAGGKACNRSQPASASARPPGARRPPGMPPGPVTGPLPAPALPPLPAS